MEALVVEVEDGMEVDVFKGYPTVIMLAAEAVLDLLVIKTILPRLLSELITPMQQQERILWLE